MQLVPQDQISGFIWHETYLKHLDSQASKGAQVCANRLISWVSNFSSPLSGYIYMLYVLPYLLKPGSPKSFK